MGSPHVYDMVWISPPDEWMKQAACRPPEGESEAHIWFPEGERGKGRTLLKAEREQAKQCAAMECPVIAECLYYAVTAVPRIRTGVWGGMGSQDREVYAIQYNKDRQREAS